MDTLRLALIIIGVLILGGIYLYSTRRRDATHDLTHHEPHDSAPRDRYKFDYTPDSMPSADSEELQQSAPENPSDQLGDIISQEKSKPALRTQTEPHRSSKRKPVTASRPAVRRSTISESSVDTEASPTLESSSETSQIEDEPQIQIANQTFPDTEDDQNNVVDGVAGFAPIIVLNIVARHGAQFQGSDILNAVQATGMEFGDMGVFHRFTAGNSRRRPIFSLANMLEPGSFDFEDMAKFSSAGLTLFMQLPVPVDSLHAYEDMLNTAQNIGGALTGDVCDDRHNILTLQAIDHTREQLREFNYKLMVAHKRAELER